MAKLVINPVNHVSYVHLGRWLWLIEGRRFVMIVRMRELVSGGGNGIVGEVLGGKPVNNRAVWEREHSELTISILWCVFYFFFFFFFFLTTYHISLGYEGTLCGSCIQGYYALGTACQKCAATPYLTLIGVGIALILGFFLSKIELNFHHLIRLKIYSTFAQLLGLVMYVDVPWPPVVKKVRRPSELFEHPQGKPREHQSYSNLVSVVLGLPMK